MSLDTSQLKVLVIVGPTASGKSALAMELARRYSGEIISADSMQVYRGMDLGTAKPTPEERAQIPHHMLDLVEPGAEYSIAQFQQQGREVVADIAARGKLPLVVGGSGLYVRALIDDLELPEANSSSKLREELEARIAAKGLPALWDELHQVDPETALRIDRNNPRRVIRAMEIWLETGTRPSQQASGVFDRPPRSIYNAALTGLLVRREALYAAIEARALTMIAHGLLEETRELIERGVSHESQALQALGYKQLVPYLKGKYSLEEALRLIKRDTRRFAKRQYTWFKADPRISWLETEQYPDFCKLAEVAWQQAEKAWQQSESVT